MNTVDGTRRPPPLPSEKIENVRKCYVEDTQQKRERRDEAGRSVYVLRRRSGPLCRDARQGMHSACGYSVNATSLSVKGTSTAAGRVALKTSLAASWSFSGRNTSTAPILRPFCCHCIL